MVSTKEHLKSSTRFTDPDPLKADFRNFLYVVWKHLGLPDPTPIQYDIAVYLQHGPKRSIIEAFRGVGKSWVTSAFVCWLLYCNPDHKILVVSASKIRADDFTTFTLRLIKEMPVLQHLIPKPDQRESKVAFDVGPAKASHSPSVKSVGITGQLAGSRADTIIADDVEIPNNSQTQAMRDKLSELVKEFDAILKPGGRIIYLGTPQTEQSLYNELPNRGYQVRIWPARIPDEKQRAIYGERLAPYIDDLIAKGWKAGASTDPKRFSEEDLWEREASYGRAGFSLQFMLDTRLSDADRYPLKLSDLIVMSLNPTLAPLKVVWASSPELAHNELPNVGFAGDRLYRPMWVDKDWTEYTGSVMAIDPSGRGGDETGFAVVKFLHGFQFVTAAGGLPGGYDDDTLLKLAQTAKLHGVNHVIIEANFGDGMFTKLIQPVFHKVHPCKIEEVKHSMQKERRIIDTLEPVMMQHRLVIDPRVIEQDFKSVQTYPPERAQHYMLTHQLTRITRDRGSLVKDDRLDALAIAVAYWSEHMARDADKAKAALRERQLQEELDKFLHGIGGKGRVPNLWVRV
ncbi:phage-related DNA maturase [Azorhizobium caulinodans ORS 571]|uniref:Phage-related DNA maturase n=1 Tax=Azorhizobium caulinodans (strain ATCC 43989 / DSM 5975 / JCM 20966 / LMG 6465 / NBRC 14845 / NCIMB 13405 / ORS 571) TaxID=438753 RepID=A8IF47_AZOC5|nr:phage terminase large subunit [Azorhizobium caulinodans]BAF89573.1 phage-related DNA maturase [Azorhizobium caulinodans ORS 571]